ncbi:hypothetical protein PF005_g11592 [Phytophthora fragariae]|nr:hypothetical protein PF009_g12682 [Phytophthora fragariae]KAE9144325.1 hypothetical protein PF006_g10725 [Phytophthora fragariae]KAE9210051.1 hypothetical protein PF005_g11592 [Phytophthora fragariae]KAE9230234.1 hypothetical protein PF004_g10553 [Phytophthora fragariae]KAE9309328.1 hypothetical protein PF001_g10738 [Phytophthora fragariae]
MSRRTQQSTGDSGHEWPTAAPNPMRASLHGLQTPRSALSEDARATYLATSSVASYRASDVMASKMIGERISDQHAYLFIRI